MRRNEERSETERHWDAIAIIAVSTAATAAVFLIMGNGGADSPRWADLPVGEIGVPPNSGR